MLHRIALVLSVLALVGLVVTPALAAQETVEGKILVLGKKGVILVETKDGKEISVAPLADGKITSDGKECKIDDLKPGMKVKATGERKGKVFVATKIEADSR
jgi:hypothetical protein